MKKGKEKIARGTRACHETYTIRGGEGKGIWKGHEKEIGNGADGK